MKLHQKLFALMMMAVSVILASMSARASTMNEVEVTCRSKAKEIALQAYQSCVTESRAAKLQSIREGYKAEIAAVKSKYESMLQEFKSNEAKAAEDKAADSKTASAPVAQPAVKKAVAPGKAKLRPEKPVTGVAKTLPAKQFDNGPAQPILNEAGEVTVVPSEPFEHPALKDPDLAQIEDNSGF